MKVGKARHPQNREVGPTLNVGVHHHAGSSLHYISEIVAGIRKFGDLLLVHGRGEIAICCLNERSLIGHVDRGTCLGNFER